MKALITGATGFLGKVLVARLAADGIEPRIWARTPDNARATFPGMEVVKADRDAAALDRAIEGVDQIYNLAGEPVIGPRWTDERRRVLEDSRIGLTNDLVAAIGRASTKPKVLVSGSAVGFYGSRGDEVLTEASGPGADYLAKMCVDWENAANGATAHGVRVAYVRTGLVLGKTGGALERMVTPFKLGVGGKLGSGKQWMPWIHVTDLVELFRTAGVTDRYRGPFDGSAPHPVTNEEFTKTFGKVLHRPTIAPVPKIALKVLFGEAAEVLLASQRVLPEASTKLGFTFVFPQLEPALRDLFPG